MPTVDNHAAILRHYGVSPDAFLGRGMEASAYHYDATTVLKIHHGGTTLTHIQTLQTFYDALDTSQISYTLPRIERVALQDDTLITFERFLPGARMKDVLCAEDPANLDHWIREALNTLQELRSVELAQPWNRFKLFDDDHLSLTRYGDWHAFLLRYLAHRLRHTGPALGRDVSDFAAKVERLRERLRQPYTGEYSLIHGDFCPGNLLVDDKGHVSSLLDFGLLTMWGDPLFDIATSWVFFDMYDELRADAWKRYRSVIEETLNTALFSTLAQYILFYSIISANTYDPQCADGHYRWCAANLNNPVYWELLDG